MQATREKLLAAASEGTLTYSHHLGGFSFRVSVEVTARDAAKRQAPTRPSRWPWNRWSARRR